MKSNLFCKFVISDLELSVRLGCRAYEKKKNQTILATIEFCLKDMPSGIKTDKLEGTVCYSKLTKRIQRFVEGKSFNLVEKFSKEIHNCVCDFLVKEKCPAMFVKVTIHKRMIKSSAIKGGIFFTYAERAS